MDKNEEIKYDHLMRVSMDKNEETKYEHFMRLSMDQNEETKYNHLFSITSLWSGQVKILFYFREFSIFICKGRHLTMQTV